MIKSMMRVFMMVFMLAVLLPIQVSAESADAFMLDEAGNVVIASQHAAKEGVSSLCFSLKVEMADAGSVRFEFAPSSAKVQEYRYNGTCLNVYLAGTDALFAENATTLAVGRVVIENGAAAMVGVVESSLQYVYGTEAKTMEDVGLPGVVNIIKGQTPGSDTYMDGDLTVSNGKYYFYEDGVMAASKEAYVNGAWRWFDEDGSMAVDKDVFQTSNGGKWVRYNEKGEMIKGEDFRYGGWYYFEPVTGVMVKGPAILADGRKVFYDMITGQMLKGSQIIGGEQYCFDEIDGHLVSGRESFIWLNIDGKDYWYEEWQRQGWNPMDETYRGKEIYDPASNAWYWLDNVQQGAKAVSKDVYQESDSAYPDRPDGKGKWVRYDEQGRMVKGWLITEPGIYYFEPITGSMAKGTVTIEGIVYHFDEITGVCDVSKNP